MTNSRTATPLDTDSAIYKTLLESTKAIPWKFDWAGGQFTYIGPQIENLLGWAPSSWKSAEDWLNRVHPEDRALAVNFGIAQAKAGVDHEVDYRLLDKFGNYVWIRGVVHVVRGAGGEIESLIGFMIDISERKKNEEQLARLSKNLEALSFKDDLTGVANRRQFNLTFDKEWARARRSLMPLSLIMLDIDFFKQYNDHYGHVQGDECLRRVGLALSSAPVRSSDLIARYGGEEFALLLPDTSLESARQVAEKCRHLILRQQIPHAKSSISDIVTVSLGVGTVTPTSDGSPLGFIEQVDKLLYQAKQNGRNRVESMP